MTLKCYVAKDAFGFYHVGRHAEGKPYLKKIVFESERADDCIRYITQQIQREDRQHERRRLFWSIVVAVAFVVFAVKWLS